MKKFALLIFGLALAVLATLVLTSRHAVPEPVYQGKPLSTWALELNNAATRDKAIEVFLHLDSDLAPALARMLRTPDPVSARIVKALGRRAPKKTAVGLYHMVNPFDAPARRAAAAQALRTMRTNAAPAIPALSLALQDDRTVSWHAALALAECGPAGTAALINGLSDKAVQQRGFVCYALGSQAQAASNAIPALTAVLQRDSKENAETAAQALANIGRLAVPALVESLSHTNLQVRLCAINALSNVLPPPRDVVPKLTEAAKHDQTAARVAAILAMARIQPTGAVVITALAQALRDPDRQVKLAAIQGLGRSPTTCQSAIPDLLAVLKDPSSEIRENTVRLLGEMQAVPDSAKAELNRCLADESEAVRSSANRALEKLARATGGADKSARVDRRTAPPAPPK